jgi:hypothetical protein
LSYFDHEKPLDNELEYQFQKHYSRNCVLKTCNNSVTLSKISEIDHSTPVIYNSVNVFVGRWSSGKTYTCIKEFINLFHASERTHLLVYISKYPNIIDPTFTEFKRIMWFYIVFVSADEADEYTKHLFAYKTVYEKIAESTSLGDEDLDEENVEDLLNSLAVPDFIDKGLHTIIFLDDSAIVDC